MEKERYSENEKEFMRLLDKLIDLGMDKKVNQSFMSIMLAYHLCGLTMHKAKDIRAGRRNLQTIMKYAYTSAIETIEKVKEDIRNEKHKGEIR